MPSLFDKLGDLLSEALETGNLPPSKEAPACEEPSFFYEDASQQHARSVPEQVKAALAFLAIPETASFDEAKKSYREKLMYYHPDRRNDNPVLQKVAKEKTERLLREWAVIENWYEQKKD